MSKCHSCFRDVDVHKDVCPYCGSLISNVAKQPIYLPPGTVLQERYILGDVIKAGGFGLIYKAWDSKLETIVAVKEFFATSLVSRAAGTKDVIVNKKGIEEFAYRKARFLAEARSMAKFGNSKYIPNVFEFFEENGTAYIVMELLSGVDLQDYMRSAQKMDVDFAIFITNQIGNALKMLHKEDIIHRDVAPDNIYIKSAKDLSVILLDLGAAKLADAKEDVVDIILKPGYSPIEQYEKNMEIGPWSDVYALGATLYVMLTGIKPGESTNRRIEDCVVPPHELDATIPENLSYAVMKAMALDKHMRFKNIDEFLQAVNGEKKVVSLAKEKKHRRNKRMGGVLAGIMATVLIVCAVLFVYNQKKHTEDLDAADIVIWYAASENSDEIKAMERIAEDFHHNYPHITITLRSIPEEAYVSELEQALKDGKLPTLFESTDLDWDSAILKNAVDLKTVLKSEQAKKCLFLDKFTHYYPDYKKIPLGIEIPVAYVITSGYTAVNYTNDYFTEPRDFGENTSVAVDEIYKDLVDLNFEEFAYADKASFMNNQQNTSPVMLSSTMAMNQVREQLVNYQKKYVYPDCASLNCGFVYEWSIGNGSDAEVAAATRLLSWMFGHSYQNILMISHCSDGQIPVNPDSFMEKIDQKNYEAIEEIYTNFCFSR